MINCICIHCEVVFVLKFVCCREETRPRTADEYVDKTEKASLVERMMGSIVRQAVEGGGELHKTLMNRKTGINSSYVFYR